MKIKTKALEKAITDSINDLTKSSFSCEESFAIHEEDGVQVQIVVTMEEDGFHDELLPEYVKASS